MANRHERAWFGQLQRFGVKSLLKLVLAVFALLYFVLLVSFLPGTDRVSAALPVPFSAIVNAVGTVALLALLYKIATQANTLISGLQTDASDLRDCIAGVVYWGVMLLAILVAYVGLGAVGRDVFARAGFAVFYPLFFALMAMIPLTFLLVEVGVYVHGKRAQSMAAQVAEGDVQSDEQLVVRILRKNDGLIYQGEFADATGWSASKVSRVLSAMEDEGQLTRFRLGREKVVCLPGHEPAFLGPTDPSP